MPAKLTTTRATYRKLVAESEKRLANALNGGLVFSFDQAAWVVVGGHVTEMDVARQGAEEGNAVSNEHRDASDDEALWRDRGGAGMALGVFVLVPSPDGLG